MTHSLSENIFATSSTSLQKSKMNIKSMTTGQYDQKDFVHSEIVKDELSNSASVNAMTADTHTLALLISVYTISKKLCTDRTHFLEV